MMVKSRAAGNRGAGVRYHLRCQIVPGPRAEQDARDLAAFCRRHAVEEVVLFVAGEEWNHGLLSAREEEQWFDTLAQIKPILEDAGIATSLNPWATVLHCDRGRLFPEDRQFKPMVSPCGETARAVASFADPAWQSYIRQQYGRFSELGFRVLWVEDDFRFHNHSPLTWGGGFEPGVLKRFEKKLGRKVTREHVVANILKPGRPHPWRAVWMETWRELQHETASGLARAVAEHSSSGSRLGLMSSHPATHSVEGRDWHALFEALGVQGRVAHRPNFASYAEVPGTRLAYSFMQLDAQKRLRPADCEVAPEIENFPFTRWRKSHSLTWAQMAAARFHGADALLLDVFPFCGNPVGRVPDVGELLDKSRPALKWIAARFPSTLQTCGIGLPWREDAQAHVQTARGASMDELDADFCGPGEFFTPYGIPVSCREQNVKAVFGNLAWAFDDAAWRDMLGGGLLLDAVSADILCKRGFGAAVGVRFRKWLDRDHERSAYSLEQVVSRRTGVPTGHFFSVNKLERLAVLEPRQGSEAWTSVITPERKKVGAGVVTFENPLGGRVVTMAAPAPEQLARSDCRRDLVHRLVTFLCKGRVPFATVTGAPNLMPMQFEERGRRVLVLANGSPDPLAPVIRLPAGAGQPQAATLLKPLCRPVKVRLQPAAGGTSRTFTLTGRVKLPYLGYLVVEF